MRLNLAAVLFAAVIGGTLLAGPAAAAPDQTQGVVLLSATIKLTLISQILIRGVGVVSATRISEGFATVKFNRPVLDCAYQATMRQSITNIAIPAGVGTAIVASVSTQPDTLVVVTNSLFNGDMTDLSFDLMVFCAR